MRDWEARRERITTPETLAWHEAGHAVVAYEHGWWLKRGGVRIDDYAEYEYQIGRANTSGILGHYTSVCVSMAGLLAEEKFHGVQWGWEADVIRHVHAVHAGRKEASPFPWGGPTDLRSIALAFTRPGKPLIPLVVMQRVFELRDQTRALLDAPRVWGNVERVAGALMRHRRLSPRKVRELLELEEWPSFVDEL